ncbi:MAG TPA: glycosyltransferase [Thermoanaerobaculia bacterium]
MTIFGISIVRNEADILRINVLHHLALGIDRFLIVDNGSSDGTDRVLRELGADRRIRWTRDDGPYRQSEITTELAREAVREGARWVLPIDADEFWWASGGDLRRLLDDSEAGALRAQVLNFVQRRDQIDSSPDALLSMTKRAPLPIGPLERVRERVESGRFAYVEMMYQPKWIFRPSTSVEVAMGNHAVTGVDGPEMDTGEIVCFHALLRSRAALELKVEQGRRVEELGLDPVQSWHARRWKRLKESGDLEREWRANSYEGNFLDVYGVPHRLVFDPRLRNLVRPWILASEEKKARVRSISSAVDKSGRRRPPRSRPGIDGSVEEEVAWLLETIHEQMSAQVAEQGAAEASLRREVGSRDEIIQAVQSELQEKVEERDRLIRTVQDELYDKVGERDALIRDLQAELHSKVAERDGIIRDLQSTIAEVAGSSKGARQASEGPPAGIDLQAEWTTTRNELAAGRTEIANLGTELRAVGARLERLHRIEEELPAARLRLEAVEAELRAERQRREDREKQLREAGLELQRQASLERRLRSAETEIRNLRALLEDTDRRRREAEAASLNRSEELVRIHRSRFWKIGCLYWRVTGLLRRLFAPAGAGGGERSVAASGAQPAAPAVEATEERAGLPPGEKSPSSSLPPPPATPPPAPAPPGLRDGDDPRRAQGNRFDVVCLPIIDWHFRFQRPQQLMSRFAEAGHRVFYVAPWVRTSGALYEVTQARPNVFEVSLRGPECNVYTDVLDEAARDALMEALDSLRRDYGLGATAIFVQLPFWSRLAIAVRERYAWPIVYDCMDHHAGFSTNRREMLEQEELLFEAADLVVTTSSQLEQQAARHNPNRLVLRNACDFDHFAGSAVRNGSRPVVGYYGAIADWFDSDLVADLAERRPDWDFVLIGDTFTADVERLRTLGNVRFLGEKPYSEIPAWLASFDVAIIPFKRIPLTEATNPVKAYEILAAGKPLISVPLPEMVLLGPLVRLASDAAEFDEQITAALEAFDWRRVAERRSFARENTWESRLASLAPRVAAAFPKVSIVVVTYNNLELTRRCLESLYAQTEWPNLEVIVVDNASSDGTPEYLREVRDGWPGFEVILNPENMGFARASNLGFRRASGDFFVLLNNDVVVTRGWLSALIRHLRRDPTIGIVGPATNAIGNEAMVPVGYSGIEQMPRWAASFVRDHDGESFDISMLAMFCVALRRSVFDEVGPLDERFGVGMFEDDDYSLRVRHAGYRVVCAEDSFVHHWMKASFSRLSPADYQSLFDHNRKLFEEKWGTVWVPHSAARKPATAGGPANGKGRGVGSVALEPARPAASWRQAQ